MIRKEWLDGRDPSNWSRPQYVEPAWWEGCEREPAGADEGMECDPDRPDPETEADAAERACDREQERGL